MSQQSDVSLANQGFADFRAELNNILAAFNTNHSGSSRPSSAVAGSFWLDTTSATAPILKHYDGSDDITVMTFSYSANTVDLEDSSSTGFADPMTTRGDVIVRNSSNVTARLAVGSANRALLSDGTDIAYGQVSLTSGVTGTLPTGSGGTGSTSTTYCALGTNISGTLPVGNGGTGATTLTSNNVILGNGSSAVAFVAPSTSGNVLTSNGSTWQSTAAGGDFVLITSQTASSSASLDFTALDNSTYSSYFFTWTGVSPTSDGVNLYIRTSTDGGSSYDTSGYSYNGNATNEAGTYQGFGSGSASFIQMDGTGFGTASSEVGSGHMWLYDPGDAGEYTQMTGRNYRTNATSNNFSLQFGGQRESAADVDAIQFYFSSGNISDGTFKMWGVK